MTTTKGKKPQPIVSIRPEPSRAVNRMPLEAITDIAERANLPNRVLRAFDNAKHLGGLKRGVKDTLAELCRFIAQDRPFDTIFAHKGTIASRIGASERTIYRHLAELQQHQLIEVLEQERRSRSGRFAVARIRLTRTAAVLLGFIGPVEGATPSPTVVEPGVQLDRCSDSKNFPAAVAPVASTNSNTSACPSAYADTAARATGVIPTVPYDKMSCGHTLSEPTISKSQPLQRTENGLPVDLAWLCGNGLSRAGVFKLMRTAKQRGKYLSDIVLVVEEYIRELKGGKLYAYLAKLADGPTDFAVAATVERQRRQEAEKARALARKAEVFRARFRNTCLTNRSQTRLYVIDDRARFAQIFVDGYPTTVPLTDLGEWIERVENGRLVLATLATERRLLR